MSSVRRLRSVSVPFGIGTVVAVCSVALVVVAGAVLSGPPVRSYDDGRLRGYTAAPETAWTLDPDTLPAYGQGDRIEVAGTRLDRWLIAYPSGLGRAYLMINAATGAPVWRQPAVVGLGSCAFNDVGQIACASKLGAQSDGFYLADADSGSLAQRTELDDTTDVVGVGNRFLRIDQAGYQVRLTTADGRQLWSRTFASAVRARVVHGMLTLSGTDGSNAVVDPHTGADVLRCTDCDLRIYPTGIVVAHNAFDRESVDLYGIEDGHLTTPEPTHHATGLALVSGPSTLPVLTATGAATVDETQGRYEIRDPAQPAALWSITDSELSKANTRPCGDVVVFARKNRSRTVYRLADGTHVGDIGVPDAGNPDANIDNLTCVGASDKTLVFANANQLTGFGIGTDQRWELPIIGAAEAVDGYLVLHQGQSLSKLAPN